MEISWTVLFIFILADAILEEVVHLFHFQDLDQVTEALVLNHLLHKLYAFGVSQHCLSALMQ
jgi:hypothetical protein